MEHGDPPPWDLSLYTTQYIEARAAVGSGVAHAQQSWNRLLSSKPLLYLPDRLPSGEYDVRVDRHRKPLRSRELLVLDDKVERRTVALLQQQHRVLRHWYDSAVCLQAHVRGLLARRRAQRTRQQLLDDALTAARAREYAARQHRRHHAAMRIQCVFHAHCEHLHYVLKCRQRLRGAVGLYAFRWRRTRAAIRLQRCYRLYRRRQGLWKALGTVMRLLRLSHQREALDRAAAAFHLARQYTRRQSTRQTRQQYPRETAQAARVLAHKTMLLRTHRGASQMLKETSLPVLRVQSRVHGSRSGSTQSMERLPPI